MTWRGGGRGRVKSFGDDNERCQHRFTRMDLVPRVAYPRTLNQPLSGVFPGILCLGDISLSRLLGDSIVVAPSQTLSNQEYHMLRETAIKVRAELQLTGPEL